MGLTIVFVQLFAIQEEGLQARNDPGARYAWRMAQNFDTKALDSFIRKRPPAPWQGAYKIPWHEPDFSARMLTEHLNQAHDKASRRRTLVETQSELLMTCVKTHASRVLDLGCGPGLYAQAFAKRGHDYVGVDIAPASIEHARTLEPRAHFVCADVRDQNAWHQLHNMFGSGFDLVLMNYGEFNAFSPQEADALLVNARSSLARGGCIALEVSTLPSIKLTATPTTPQTAELAGGLFCANPHILLTQRFWLAQSQVSITQYDVVDKQGRHLKYTNTLQGYSAHEYTNFLVATGCRKIVRRSSLTPDVGLHYLMGWI